MTYTPPEGVTIGTFTVDTLPASFNAPAEAEISYKIYGTEAGVGEETVNLWDPATPYEENSYINSIGGLTTDTGWRASGLVSIDASTQYTFSVNSTAGLAAHAAFYDSNRSFIDVIDSGTQTFTTPSNAVYMKFSWRKTTTEIMLTKTASAPASFIPYGYKISLTGENEDQTEEFIVYIGDSQLSATEYVDSESGKIYKLQEGVLTPTDPPAPLPSIITHDGENTISSTETLGDVEFTGEWTAIMGSTEEESIDIEFTVDAEEYIAFVTVDDDTSIQVFDTITMPASAGSFTLQVVSWGREQYTDTVYNALS